MKTLTKIFFSSLLLPLLVACENDNDRYSLDDYRIDIATVENANLSSTFLFRLDNDELLWTAATNLPFYIPKDGQRIIANYTILSNMGVGSLYDHDVKLNDVYNVLTKGIFPITPATKDSIGNDSIQIDNIWIGSDYLNIEFAYPGYDKIHYINLVSDTSKVYTDGKIHLEFRHNANGDTPTYYKSGIVSFNLKSLQTGAASKSINLVIHVNVPNQAGEKLYALTYRFGEISAMYQTPKITFPMEVEGKVY